jgi:hypothetical protein
MLKSSLPSSAAAVRCYSYALAPAIALSLTLHLLVSGWASAGFLVQGAPVPFLETNFAGERQLSPKFKVVVQINHDTEKTRDLELTIVDEVFQTLLAYHQRAPLLPSDFLTVVFITDAKMRRFFEGPKRRIFRILEGEMEKHPDVYLSPTAIFISASTLEDDQRLRTALYQGLGYLFNQEFYDAMEGLRQRGTPVPYQHD